MKKKLLPALIGMTLAGAVSVASAEVRVGGHIDLSVGGVDQDGGIDDLVMECTTCSVGFSGREDLGNGLSAIFKIDFQYDITERNNASSSTASLTDRDQWVGLAGDSIGKLRIGTISTVYKSHGAKIDPLYRTSLQGRDRGLQSRFHSDAGESLEGRATNTFRWDSVDYSGIKVGGHYTLDSDETDGEDEDPYGIGGSYSNGGILAYADWIGRGRDSSGDDRNAWKVGGRYDMGLFSFMGQYEDMQLSALEDATAWHVAAMVNNLFTLNIYLGIGQTEDDLSGDDANSWTLAVTHNMSKQTMLYGGHSQIDCDSGDPGGNTATLSICNDVGASGGEDDKTMFGIKHTF